MAILRQETISRRRSVLRGNCAIASRFSCKTKRSSPPTMNRLGAGTWPRAGPAKSGLPPRDTTARTLPGRCAAASTAAAAPVLAAEITDRETLQVRLAANPIGYGNQAPDEQMDVETQLRGAHIDRFLFGRKKIDQNGRDGAAIQDIGHAAISRALAAAAAAMWDRHSSACSTACQAAIRSHSIEGSAFSGARHLWGGRPRPQSDPAVGPSNDGDPSAPKKPHGGIEGALNGSSSICRSSRSGPPPRRPAFFPQGPR